MTDLTHPLPEPDCNGEFWASWEGSGWEVTALIGSRLGPVELRIDDTVTHLTRAEAHTLALALEAARTWKQKEKTSGKS